MSQNKCASIRALRPGGLRADRLGSLAMANFDARANCLVFKSLLVKASENVCHVKLALMQEPRDATNFKI